MLVYFVFFALVRGLCWTPNGSLSNDVPCDPFAENSICCTAGFYCTSNGLCQPEGDWKKNSDKFIRGTCTDKSWRAPECNGFCVKGNPGGGEYVMRCDNDEWCCQHEECCDNKEATRLKIGDANLSATAGFKPTTTSTQSTKTSTSSASVSNLSTSSLSTLSTSTQSQTLRSQSSELPTAEANRDESGEHNDTLKLGLGIGIGVGVAVIGIAIGLGFWLRKRKTAKVQTHGGGKVSTLPQYPVEVHAQSHGYELPTEVKIPPAELPGDRMQSTRQLR